MNELAAFDTTPEQKVAGSNPARRTTCASWLQQLAAETGPAPLCRAFALAAVFQSTVPKLTELIL